MSPFVRVVLFLSQTVKGGGQKRKVSYALYTKKRRLPLWHSSQIASQFSTLFVGM